MGLKIIFISFILPFSLSLSGVACAAGFLDVVINEIAWMGTESSYSNEWIELYNNTDSAVNLDGWSLKAVDITPEIDLAGIIPSKGFYLLERTDDDTVPALLADYIYTGAFGNKGEHLKLFDARNNLIDEVNCSDSWFVGDNSTKQTMERKNPQIPGNNSSNWQTSQNPGGTPKLQNSFGLAEDRPPQAENEEVKEEVGPVAYPVGIIFSEILPSPEGPDSENEWIEIFNKNDFEIDLSDWKISDTIGSTKTYVFPGNTYIEGLGFLVLRRPKTKITLNNNSDGLSLIRPDSLVVDTVMYEKAPLGQSYNFQDGQWAWSTSLTPEGANFMSRSIVELEESQKLVSEEKTESESAQIEILKETGQELAAIKEQVPEQGFGFLHVVLTALLVATVSGVSVLILKDKLKKMML